MNADAGAAILGIFIIVMGIANMKGNLSTLHRYHRHRVTEEDRLPFGRLVGLGTVIIGASVIVYSVCAAAAETLQNDVPAIVGAAVMIAGMIAGLALSFYAMIRYNKGIF